MAIDVEDQSVLPSSIMDSHNLTQSRATYQRKPITVLIKARAKALQQQ